MDKMSRRSFLKTGTAATAAFAMAPADMLAKAKKKATPKKTKL
ncbi:MAG: twin-arginine translocation signal domain-containing protein, partial [Bacteroidaceae bacterium]|nr:twin-arginine translocation signal domain-containing protein [Bacteroidaceae bacterium]